MTRRIELAVNHPVKQRIYRAAVCSSETSPLVPTKPHVPFSEAEVTTILSKKIEQSAQPFRIPAPHATAATRTELERDLHQSILNGKLFLHYQAQIARDNRIVGAEALVRWPHPKRGMIPPDEIISLAEHSGLILPLGLWVLNTACAQLGRWSKCNEMKDITIAVNISAAQIQQADFVEQVLTALRCNNANPYQLKLELTESLPILNLGEVIAKMIALKDMGVSFSLDDFGIGYSSLFHLSQLPLDQLKIDKFFVANIESSKRACAICAATINLAHNLKLKVVAEGVENLAQHHFLSTVHQCDLIQGYLFSKPIACEDFRSLVKHFADKASPEVPPRIVPRGF